MRIKKANLYNLFCVTSLQAQNVIPSSSSNFNVELKTIPFSYKWEIDGFSTCNRERIFFFKLVSPFIISRTFSPPNKGEYKFKLKLYPNGEDENGYISLYLINESDPSNIPIIQFQFSLIPSESDMKTFQKKFNPVASSIRKLFNLSSPREPTSRESTSMVYCPKFNTRSGIRKFDLDWGFSKYMKIVDIYQNGLLKNDTLTILCEGEIFVQDKLSDLDLENRFNIIQNIHQFNYFSTLNNSGPSTMINNSDAEKQNVSITTIKNIHIQNSVVNNHSNIKTKDINIHKK